MHSPNLLQGALQGALLTGWSGGRFFFVRRGAHAAIFF